jgi:hypothetical protein
VSDEAHGVSLHISQLPLEKAPSRMEYLAVVLLGTFTSAGDSSIVQAVISTSTPWWVNGSALRRRRCG